MVRYVFSFSQENDMVNIFIDEIDAIDTNVDVLKEFS